MEPRAFFACLVLLVLWQHEAAESAAIGRNRFREQSLTLLRRQDGGGGGGKDAAPQKEQQPALAGEGQTKLDQARENKGEGEAAAATKQQSKDNAQAKQDDAQKDADLRQTADLLRQLQQKKQDANSDKGGDNNNNNGGGGDGGGGGNGGNGGNEAASSGIRCTTNNPLEKTLREKVVAFLEKYNGATEPDARFNDLFPDIQKTRDRVPGYTTCVDFVRNAFGRTGIKMISGPNVNFFDRQLRKKNHLPANAFYQLVKKNVNPAPQDDSAILVDLEVDKERPVPGDVFLLQFGDGKWKGYFSHMSVIYKYLGREGNIMKWSVIQGGAGCSKCHQEAVRESVTAVDVTTNRIVDPKAVANQAPGFRLIRGWVSVGALIKDPQ